MFSTHKFFPKPCRKYLPRIAEVVMSSFDCLIMMVGPLLATIATTLIILVSYTWFTNVIPTLMEREGFFWTQVYTVIGLWLLGNLLFNYFSTMYHGPGNPPKIMDDERKALLIDDPENRPGMTHRYCNYCNIVKPMRAHHCSICKKCVLKMDHHCPWVNTCVGWRNHKHFLLFLFYMWTASGYYITICWSESRQMLFGRVTETNLYLIAIVLAFSAFVAVSLFLGWTTFLMVTNHTTIEFYTVCAKKDKQNPFNLGFWRNCEEVFGTQGRFPVLSWFMPSIAPPPGDGCIYPMQVNGDIKNEGNQKFNVKLSGLV